VTTPPTVATRGWYRDPESPTKWRFWDGSNWQESTIDFPARPQPREMVTLAREAAATQWLYVPVAILIVVFMAIDTARLPLIPNGSMLSVSAVLGYPVWHVLLARSARRVGAIYDLPVRPFLLWIPVVGPLVWWHVIGYMQRAPLWARLAPLWCTVGAFAATVHEPVQQVAVGLMWVVGIMGSVVVVSGFRRAVLIDTQSPVAP